MSSALRGFTLCECAVLGRRRQRRFMHAARDHRFPQPLQPERR